MGTIGSCCCDQPCEPCAEQAGLTTWSIYESLWGFTFNGEFGELRDEECYKTTQKCEIEQNILHDSCSNETAWTDYTQLWACGACIDCETGVMPPPCDQDLSGNVNCPPNYPTYTTVEISAREKIVTQFWYSKAIQVEVFLEYIGDKVKFRIVTTAFVSAAATYAIAFQQRYRRAEYWCVYDTLQSQTVYENNAFPSLSPIEPCVDLLELGLPYTDRNEIPFYGCGEFEEPTDDPSNCDSSTIVTITDDPCIKVINGECFNDPETWQLTTLRTVACCDMASPVAQARAVYYESELFDCDEVPSNIELLPVEVISNRFIDLDFSEFELCEISNIQYTFPTSLTLTVA